MHAEVARNHTNNAFGALIYIEPSIQQRICCISMSAFKILVSCLLLVCTAAPGVGADQPKVVPYGLVGLKNASTGLVPDDFQECEKRCAIEKKTNPNEFLEEQRNAFNW